MKAENLSDLSGQMLYMDEWDNHLLFLASPVLMDIESLVNAGLYINDLPLHDCSRYVTWDRTHFPDKF